MSYVIYQTQPEQKSSLKGLIFVICIQQADSMLSCTCAEVDHRGCQNMEKQKRCLRDTAEYVTDVLTTFWPPVIHNWKDPRQHGISLFYVIKKENVDSNFICVASIKL